ncbi:MAG: flagellin [Eisenbergiella sp.]
MRITESMLTGSYTRNLQRNISNLAQSNLKLSSEREYNHVSEDPARAAKAFAVRDQIALSEEHIRTVKSAMGELDTADKNIQSINSILQTVFEKATKAGGVTNQENLNAIAEELHGLNEEILQTMNARYGDKYLFSGSGNEEAPFTVDGGRLFFNGKAVDDYDKDDRIPILTTTRKFIWMWAWCLWFRCGKCQNRCEDIHLRCGCARIWNKGRPAQ